MQHQHARGDVPRGRAKTRLAGIVEAFDYLKLRNVRGVAAGGRIEVELALFHQLQDRGAGDRLSGREDRKALSVVMSSLPPPVRLPNAPS